MSQHQRIQRGDTIQLYGPLGAREGRVERVTSSGHIVYRHLRTKQIEQKYPHDSYRVRVIQKCKGRRAN